MVQLLSVTQVVTQYVNGSNGVDAAVCYQNAMFPKRDIQLPCICPHLPLPLSVVKWDKELLSVTSTITVLAAH